jgi:hypothetical protein
MFASSFCRFVDVEEIIVDFKQVERSPNDPV